MSTAASSVCPYVWSGGQIVEATSARVSPIDHGVLVGDGVFETCKVIDGCAFAIGRHLRRLQLSATTLGIIPPELDVVRAAVDATISANEEADTEPITRLRITVSSGEGVLGSLRGDHEARLLVAAATTPAPAGPALVATVPWVRNERGALAGLKTTSYAGNVRALEFAVAKGAHEAIFANTRDMLCEGTGTNVFVVLDDEIVTPPLSAGPLAGITRELVLETSPVTEANMAMADFLGADEAFLTSSTRDVMAMGAIDGRPLPVVNGPRTRDVSNALAELMAKTLDP